MIMKYWGFLLLKLVAGAVVMRFVWAAILLGFRAQVAFWHSSRSRSVTILALPAPCSCSSWPASACVHLIIWDQRYRCRTCLRRLRMPVSAGSWPNMLLFGQPRTEYICLYGHGTLKVPEFA